MSVAVKSSLLFEVKEATQDLVVEALNLFSSKLKSLSFSLDAVYPADPYSLPFALLLSDWLGVPVKGEPFLTEREKVLLLFSLFPFKSVGKRYLYEKVNLFRKKYPFSPSLLVLSSERYEGVDFQLIKGNFGRLFSYSFLKEAEDSFFWPIEGEITYYSHRFWELSRKEANSFLRVKRIKDAARRYLNEVSVNELKVVDGDFDLSLWERFKKGLFTFPLEPEEERPLDLKEEKLFQVKDKLLGSAVTSILEFLSQTLEYHYPTYLAYSNYEVVDRKGILVVPKVKEDFNGVDLTVEFRVNDLEKRDFERVCLLVERAIRELKKEVLGDSFSPTFEWNGDEELRKFTLYLSWFIDREVAQRAYGRINKEWLLSRLLSRKRSKSSLLELFKLLKEFEFNLENYHLFKEKLSSLWERSPKLLKVKGKELCRLIDLKGLWPLIAYLCSYKGLKEELCNFLSLLKGFESYHQLLASLNVYFCPVITKRRYRPYWERVIRGERELLLKGEFMNPSSPFTYVLQTQEGERLGELPKKLSRYLFAKERSGKRLFVRELYFEPDFFSENSYWVEVKCL
ncbi:hypothetical protein [Thermovibrio sp.]